MNTIDLHNHTIASLDGTYQPEELVDIALNSNIEIMAVCDHDSVESCQRALCYSKDKNITVIPAIELSCKIDDTPLHILGYNIDYIDKAYQQRYQYVRQAVDQWAPQIIQKALDYGFKFDPQKPYTYRQDHVVCEELIGRAIFEDHRNDDDERLKDFRTGGKYSDNPTFNFYKYLCATNKPLYVPYSFNMDIKDAEKLIHQTGGKMFLAHPFHNIKKSESLFEKIVACNIDGVEVFSSYHDKETTDYYYQLAKKYNLYMSVGSDFHGESKPAIKMGCNDYDHEELEKTIKFIQNK